MRGIGLTSCLLRRMVERVLWTASKEDTFNERAIGCGGRVHYHGVWGSGLAET